jgi:putative DNA primase/helicase
MKTETVIFDIIVPHLAPVNIAELLTDIEAVIKRHVILNDHAAAALAVWVLHTYMFELRDTVAYVAIESPEKRCGKTTLLSVLAAMACKSLIASNITVGALFRAIHTCTPTLFIDEADTFLAGNSIMRGIINSGNTRRTAYVLRLAAKKNQVSEHGTHPYSQAVSETQSQIVSLAPIGRESRGEGAATPQINQQSAISHQPPSPPDTGLKKYSCWCPKVIAMIGEVPDTIADRSIVVKMARKLTTETCAPLALLNTGDIKSRCARFALDARDAIAQHPKISSDGLNDRATDTFDPLLVIARLAGNEWEQKLRAAALGLSSIADTENSGSGLILDIVDLFVERGSDKMFSRDIVARLRDGGMKSQTLKYSSINEYHISKTLRHYGIKPVSIRIGKEVHRGYLATHFREAMGRYVSEEDIRSHVEELRSRCQLHVEARAEAAKQQALMEKVVAAIPRGKFLTQHEIMELALKIQHEEAGSTREPNGNVNVGFFAVFGGIRV